MSYSDETPASSFPVTAEEVATEARAVLEAGGEELKDAVAEASDEAQGWLGGAVAYIRANPLRAVGIAVGVGFVLGAKVQR